MKEILTAETTYKEQKLIEILNVHHPRMFIMNVCDGWDGEQQLKKKSFSVKQQQIVNISYIRGSRCQYNVQIQWFNWHK